MGPVQGKLESCHRHVYRAIPRIYLRLRVIQCDSKPPFLNTSVLTVNRRRCSVRQAQTLLLPFLPIFNKTLSKVIAAVWIRDLWTFFFFFSCVTSPARVSNSRVGAASSVPAVFLTGKLLNPLLRTEPILYAHSTNVACAVWTLMTTRDNSVGLPSLPF